MKDEKVETFIPSPANYFVYKLGFFASSPLQLTTDN